MISEIRAHFKSTAIAKWAEATTSNCGEAAVVATAEQNETGNTPPSRCIFLFSPFMKVVRKFQTTYRPVNTQTLLKCLFWSVVIFSKLFI